MKQLNIVKYRKLHNLNFDFSNGINLIAGTNGTCKTSILYMVSNSYQKVTKTRVSKELQNCLNIIQDINTLMNPKIESLTRGDKEYNDPSPGVKGTIYEVEYFDDYNLEFRKHNSPQADRFAIKPPYRTKGENSIPELPVIYLGLSRLIAYGEYNDFDITRIIKLLKSKVSEESFNLVENILEKEINTIHLQTIKQKLPLEYQEEINELFSSFTGINVVDSAYNKLGNLKNRADFVSDTTGVDSNTISAGEDNLYIILTALVSLKYYSETLQNNNASAINSILLIDEIDATLHPSYQLKLLKLIRDYSEKYKIQFFGTTHSITLLEYALDMKDNVIYLLDSVDSVAKIEEGLESSSIKMYLKEQTATQLNNESKIPLFTEDQEARLLLKILLEFFSKKYSNFFPYIVNNLHLVEANVSSEALKNIFNDYILSNNFLHSICILDGDQFNNKDWRNNIIVLPGKNNPETLLLNYTQNLFDETEEHYKDFWDATSLVIRKGYQKRVVQQQILAERERIEKKLEVATSTKGIRRKEYKKLFNDHLLFFSEVFKYWLHDPINAKEINDFYNDLKTMFCKTALAHGLSPALWEN